MTRGAQLSHAQADEMLARYHSGAEPVAALAAAFGVHPSYPGLLARRRGLALRDPAMAKRMHNAWASRPHRRTAGGALLTKRQIAAARRRFLSGREPVVVIAADYDIGLSELVDLAKQAGGSR